MKTQRLKAFKAWCLVSLNDRQFRIQNNDAMAYLYDRRVLKGNQLSRVIVRDARDDSEARLRRENARLRRALRDARDWLAVGGSAQACEAIVKALERRDRR